ncbi:GntR family transcriptional regulator [Deinococcus sp. QL22]|uniref:GntR family transcriptional regulator n=1 Tax=Deinococcus sp. QL22 TaxID=2939437 RepID=UPI002016C91D|nr:GntR family transcriptional regulator [Deinococcus sp. QL22]UQN08953.1 GntR family transcriptional regulator [Deinococcus sp. QL22]
MNIQRSSKPHPTRPQLVVTHLRELMSHLPPGERLPSETALSQQLQVSRTTVRDGLAALEREGLLVRQQGLGTFTAEPPLHAPLGRVLPIPDLIRAAGFEPRVDTWTRRLTPADAETQRELRLSPGTQVTLIDLLYLAGQRPAVQVTYALAPPVTRAIRTWDSFEPTKGVIDFLTPYLPHPLAHTSTRISAVSADDTTAAALHLTPGSALLRFVTLGISTTGERLYRNVSAQSGQLLDVHILRMMPPLGGG